MPVRSYREDYEWKNHRGQVFVQKPKHPRRRKDGFVPRSVLVMEEMLKAGLEPGQSDADYAMGIEPRNLLPEERVLHLDGVPGNDEPGNLMLFPSQKALAQWRSARFAEAAKESNRKTVEDFNRMIGATKRKLQEGGAAGARASAAKRGAGTVKGRGHKPAPVRRRTG
jgi:hypothetical protein